MYQHRMGRHHFHPGLGFLFLLAFLFIFGGFILKALFLIIPAIIVLKMLSSSGGCQMSWEKRKNDDFYGGEKPKRRTFEDGTPII